MPNQFGKHRACKTRFVLDFALGALLLFVPACQTSKVSAPEESQTVARVNGEPITLESFQQVFNEVKGAGRGFFADTESANQVKRELLERLIDTRLLLQEAHRLQIEVDDAVVRSSVDLLQKQYPPGGLEEELVRQNKTLAAFQEDTADTYLLHKLMKREVIERVAVPSEDILKYYEAHKAEFQRAEEVRVRQIVVRTEEEAEDLRKQIQRGASFEELARKHSVAPEAAQGGDLGYFPRGQMPPEIEEASFQLYSSYVAKVTVSPYGFHLFQLVDRRPARQLTAEQARAEIERRMQAERIQEAEAYYIRSLREAASIERDLSLLDKVH